MIYYNYYHSLINEDRMMKNQVLAIDDNLKHEWLQTNKCSELHWETYNSTINGSCLNP